jgi:5-methylcytosine-specific restriction endonuclease McrA
MTDEIFSQHDLREYVKSRDKNTCQYCGKGRLYGAQLNLDHIHPRTAGGGDSPENLIVACKQCNHRKGKKSLADYIDSRLKALEREMECLERLRDRPPLNIF